MNSHQRVILKWVNLIRQTRKPCLAYVPNPSDKLLFQFMFNATFLGFVCVWVSFLLIGSWFRQIIDLCTHLQGAHSYCSFAADPLNHIFIKGKGRTKCTTKFFHRIKQFSNRFFDQQNFSNRKCSKIMRKEHLPQRFNKHRQNSKSQNRLHADTRIYHVRMKSETLMIQKKTPIIAK